MRSEPPSSCGDSLSAHCPSIPFHSNSISFLSLHIAPFSKDSCLSSITSNVPRGCEGLWPTRSVEGISSLEGGLVCAFLSSPSSPSSLLAHCASLRVLYGQLSSALILSLPLSASLCSLRFVGIGAVSPTGGRPLSSVCTRAEYSLEKGGLAAADRSHSFSQSPTARPPQQTLLHCFS